MARRIFQTLSTAPEKERGHELCSWRSGSVWGGADSDVERVLGLDDGEFLRLLRSDVTLSPLRLAVNSARSRRFMNDVATVVNMVRIRISDLLFCFSKGMTLSGVLQRHHDSLHTLVLVEVLCRRIEVTGKWGYSGDQQQWLRERLDNVVKDYHKNAESKAVFRPVEVGSRLEDPCSYLSEKGHGRLMEYGFPQGRPKISDR